jgi:hypothetical protein
VIPSLVITLFENPLCPNLGGMAINSNGSKCGISFRIKVYLFLF